GFLILLAIDQFIQRHIQHTAIFRWIPSVYASVYGTATAPLKPIRLLVQAQFSILLQKDPQNGFLIQNIQDAEQVEVAVLCGIWNGLVDIVAGVPKMISMLAAISS